MTTNWIMDPQQTEMGIVDFYEFLADNIFGKSFDHYDCTKINVGEEIFEGIKRYYLEKGMGDVDFGMMWVCYGPKASLTGYNVELEDGWATDD